MDVNQFTRTIFQQVIFKCQTADSTDSVRISIELELKELKITSL